jgi:hypothetical protein
MSKVTSGEGVAWMSVICRSRPGVAEAKRLSMVGWQLVSESQTGLKSRDVVSPQPQCDLRPDPGVDSFLI